jgi:hypothetical protein
MSVLSHPVIQCFSAPVSIQPEAISIIGSWNQIPMDSYYFMALDIKYQCHMRLSSWKYQHGTETVPICMDFCMIENKTTIVIKCPTKNIGNGSFLIEQSEKIHAILNKQHTKNALNAIVN